MQFLNRLRAIVVVVVKRIVSQPWLVLATLLGLVIAVALMMSIPLYADAVYNRIFLDNIATETTAPGEIPPFAFYFRYDGSIYGTLDWDELVAVDQYLTNEAQATFGLPQQLMVRYFSSDPFGIYATSEVEFSKTTSPLVWAGFSVISDLQEHVTITEGSFPQDPQPNAPLEVLISEERATDLGMQVGEDYIAFLRITDAEGFESDLEIPIRIAGVWIAADEQDPFWFVRPSTFDDRLFITEAAFSGYLGERMKGEVYAAGWYLVFDGADIHHTDASAMIRRSIDAEQRANSLLTHTTIGRSPVDALVEYQRSSNLLTILLYAFSIPILALLFAFIMLTSGLAVERRRNEVAVLRSRGAMALQMLGIALLEGLFLGLVALALSVPLGMGVAQLIGQARSFLDFTANLNTLRVNITWQTLQFGLFAVFLSIAAQVIPTFNASRHTVVSYKREQARLMKKPWWQRAWIDVIMLATAAYGAYTLQQQGSLVDLSGGANSNTPFQNPLLFLIPALLIFALTLFFLRLMPIVMTVIAWLAARTKAVGLLMAARHLARSPGFYNTPLILLVLTLSLSAFTASLAYTLDDHLYDKSFYQSGADLEFLEMGEGSSDDISTALADTSNGDASGDNETIGSQWLFLPPSEYELAEGVEKAMRVGTYPAVAYAGGQVGGKYIGVERDKFVNIAYWRDDFSDSSLGELMNNLAVNRDGILVREDFMDQHVLLPGDRLTLNVTTYGVRTEINFQIVGSFRYFPTWYPSQGELFVGNLDYLYEQAGGQYPYGIWLKTDPDADYRALGEDILDIKSLNWSAPVIEINNEQQLPERQGLFGLLSVGFAAAAILTVLGFLLYSLFSFRRRFIEFGVLRAVGLSAAQMSGFLGWELAFLILTGGVLGTALGGFVSAFFIPYLQLGLDEVSRIPPYEVTIAWSEIVRIYALFGALFVVALIALVVMLRRMRIFEAVKLGETA